MQFICMEYRIKTWNYGLAEATVTSINTRVSCNKTCAAHAQMRSFMQAHASFTQTNGFFTHTQLTLSCTQHDCARVNCKLWNGYIHKHLDMSE